MSTYLPTKVDLVEQWAIEMEPRWWELNVEGHMHSVAYVPGAKDGQHWQVRQGQSQVLYADTLQDVLTLLAERWHHTLLTHYPDRCGGRQLGDIETAQREPDVRAPKRHPVSDDPCAGARSCATGTAWSRPRSTVCSCKRRHPPRPEPRRSDHHAPAPPASSPTCSTSAPTEERIAQLTEQVATYGTEDRTRSARSSCGTRRFRTGSRQTYSYAALKTQARWFVTGRVQTEGKGWFELIDFIVEGRAAPARAVLRHRVHRARAVELMDPPPLSSRSVTTEALDVRLGALHALASWTRFGGFMPGVLDVRRAINCTITVACLGEFDIATDTDVRARADPAHHPLIGGPCPTCHLLVLGRQAGRAHPARALRTSASRGRRRCASRSTCTPSAGT